MDQVVQLSGAIAVLTAFILAQAGRLDDRSSLYLVLNLGGSALMAGVAAVTSQLGFFLLEGTWAVVSAAAIARQLLASRASAAPGRH